jgi:hypothetical protein
VHILTDVDGIRVENRYSGIEYIVVRLCSWFYWPKLYESVRVCIWGCNICLYVKATNQRLVRPLTLLEKCRSSDDKININFVLTLLIITRNNDTIVIIINSLTNCL